MQTLSTLVLLYPNIHKASYSNISSMVLRLLSGQLQSSSNVSLFRSASQLFSVLHVTGGKVGAATLWRKSVDETLELGWNTYSLLRTTFPFDGLFLQCLPSIHRLCIGQRNYKPPANYDPLVAIPLHLEQLRATVMILCDLLK